MRRHPSIVCFLLMIGSGACGDGGAGLSRDPSADRPGRVAMSWTLDGAFLTAERCKAAGVEYMEVEVRSTTGGGAVDYTEVRCDLDRYSLDQTPLGKVVLRVGGMSKDSRGQPCLRLYGEAPGSAGAAYPEAPTPVALKVVANACR